jgi:hypothetical protein
MIFWSLCAFIWFRNMKKMLLQMTSVPLQPVPSLDKFPICGLFALVYVSVTIVLMVMLMLVLARMLIFRTLVQRSTVHNNGNGDVNVRNHVKRSRKCLVV